MPKRYRLKLDHPYAEKGTIVEEYLRERCPTGSVIVRFSSVEGWKEIEIPYSVEKVWLEEVKEEVSFTKEQVDAIMDELDEQYPPHYGNFKVWLNQHTSKE